LNGLLTAGPGDYLPKTASQEAKVSTIGVIQQNWKTAEEEQEGEYDRAHIISS
jgi:hypothetical protein